MPARLARRASTTAPRSATTSPGAGAVGLHPLLVEPAQLVAHVRRVGQLDLRRGAALQRRLGADDVGDVVLHRPARAGGRPAPVVGPEAAEQVEQRRPLLLERPPPRSRSTLVMAGVFARAGKSSANSARSPRARGRPPGTGRGDRRGRPASPRPPAVRVVGPLSPTWQMRSGGRPRPSAVARKMAGSGFPADHPGVADVLDGDAGRDRPAPARGGPAGRPRCRRSCS